VVTNKGCTVLGHIHCTYKIKFDMEQLLEVYTPNRLQNPLHNYHNMFNDIS